ncbi:MAG: hypothetical protein H6711_24975 [Myxococcales bacterium]|nr:hypothetical protein [Myxococcales bacterium]
MCRNSTEIKLLPKTQYDFTYLSNGATQTIVLQPSISVAAYYRTHLLIRVHSLQMDAGQSVEFQLDNTLPSDEDPSEFIDRGVSGNPLTTVTITSSTSTPVLLSGTATDLQAGLRVRFIATQGSVPSTPFFVELSAVLVLCDF